MAASRRKLPQGAKPPAPDFMPFQLCKLEARPPEGAGWLHEIKYDGYRLQVRVQGGRATIRTRNGHDWTDKFRHLAAVAEELPDCVLDGELCAIGGDGQPNFSALRSSLARGDTDDLVYFAFDLLWEEREDLRAFALTVRKARLAAVIEAGGRAAEGVVRYVDEFPGLPSSIFKAACQMKLEGIVSKRRDATYREGYTGTWIKVKCRPSQEMVVVGWRQEGARFNSLVAAEAEPGGGLRYAGRIHTGYSRDVVDDLMRRLRPLETTRPPAMSGEAPPKRAGIHWVKPHLVAEVEMAEFTAAGKLRQASFKGLREDKTAADLSS